MGNSRQPRFCVSWQSHGVAPPGSPVHVTARNLRAFNPGVRRVLTGPSYPGGSSTVISRDPRSSRTETPIYGGDSFVPRAALWRQTLVFRRSDARARIALPNRPNFARQTLSE